MAPVFAILQNKCVPVFVDVDETWNIDVDQIESKITKRTKAILVVHNYGHPAYMPAIKKICDKHGLLLIEDCSEVIGAEVNGEFIGNWGNVSCYSFYANKIITTGEGGMITTNDPKINELVRSKKNMAFGTDQFRFEHTSIGYNYRMTNIQAAIGLGQLEYVNHAIEKKIQVANLYMRHLNGVPGIVFPPNKSWAKNVYWVFGILVTPEFGCSVAHLQSVLSAHGVETRNFFTPAHKQPFLKDLVAIEGAFPNSSFIHLHGVYLPSFVELKDADIEGICEIIKFAQRESKG
jgi:perosamine synthetase